MLLGTLCYVEKNDTYLMLHRIKKENDIHKGLWVGLGGKFEPGESPEDCVMREVYEESGLSIQNPQLRGILTFPGFANEEDWYVFLFTATEFTGELKECKEGKLAWIDKSKLNQLPMHAGDKYFLEWVDRHDGIFSAKYIYKENVLQDYKVVFY